MIVAIARWRRWIWGGYASSVITRSVNPNSAPPASPGFAQIRPPIARISRAQTNRPMPAPAAAAAVPCEPEEEVEDAVGLLGREALVRRRSP